jgi:outer membrane protein, heavy metal efflux system
MKKYLLIIPAIVLSIAITTAQTVTLDSILNAIEISNPLLKMHNANIRSLNEAAKGARSWDAPELGTGFWMTPYNPSLWKKNIDGTTGMGQYMISVTQMIANKKQLNANEKYMEAKSSVNEQDKQAVLNELYAAAKKSYYTWMVVEKKLKILDENEKLLDFMSKSAELRYKNNLGKIDAYYKVKAALGNIENTRLMMNNEIRQQRITINTLMNKNKQEVFRIDTVYSIKDYRTVDSSYFIQTRSDIKAIDNNIQITGLEQDLERSKLKPQYGGTYSHMFGFGGFPQQFTLMATVKLPIASWSSRSIKANIESLNWRVEALNQQKQMMINEAAGNEERLMMEIDTKKKQMALYEKNIIPALLKNYQTIQLGYEQNTEDLFTLLDGWQTLNMTELEYLQQLLDLLMLQVDLDKILEIK